MYLNHVQLIGFLGQDPEERQAKSNGNNFLVLSLATQQSWKDANDEWQAKTDWHRVTAFGRLAEAVSGKFKKGDHLLVEGMLVSTTYENDKTNGKSKTKKDKKSMLTYWNVRARVIRKLNRGNQTVEHEPAPGTDATASSDIPF